MVRKYLTIHIKGTDYEVEYDGEVMDSISGEELARSGDPNVLVDQRVNRVKDRIRVRNFSENLRRTAPPQ